jgi:hypothetical protein
MEKEKETKMSTTRIFKEKITLHTLAEQIIHIVNRYFVASNNNDTRAIERVFYLIRKYFGEMFINCNEPITLYLGNPKGNLNSNREKISFVFNDINNRTEFVVPNNNTNYIFPIVTFQSKDNSPFFIYFKCIWFEFYTFS